MAIFGPQEMMSRKQFYHLFCSKYIYAGERKGALNDQPWNAQIMYEILHKMFPQNILVPDDIEAITQIVGMWEPEGVYFHCHENEPLAEPVLRAISPYISEAAYLRYAIKMPGMMDTVAEFYKHCCCTRGVTPERVPLKDLHAAYTTWCAMNILEPYSKSVFVKRSKALGYVYRKGYVDKKHGIQYMLVALDRSKVGEVIEEQSQQEAAEEREVQESIPGFNSGGTPEVGEDDVVQRPQEATRKALTGGNGIVEQVSGGNEPVSFPNIAADEDPEDGGDGSTADPSEALRGAGIDGIPDGEAECDDNSAGSESGSSEEGAGDQPATQLDTISRVNKLPLQLRRAFKELKMTYRVTSGNVTDEDVVAAITAIGLKADEYTVGLFFDYAAI